MQKPSRKSRAPKQYQSLKEFAAALDVPLTTLSGWVKHERWRWNRRSPWSDTIRAEVRRWAAEELQKGRPATGGDDEIKELRRQKLVNEVRKLLASAETAETALARERGELVDATEVEREWAGIGVVVRNAMQNLGPQLVPLALSHGMPHQAAPTFGAQIQECIAGVLRHLSRDGAEDDSDSEA